MNQAAYRLEQTKLTDSKVFRDAVHNYIHVDQPLILDLINSHEMQRLRRIKQLGGTHQVYQRCGTFAFLSFFRGLLYCSKNDF